MTLVLDPPTRREFLIGMGAAALWVASGCGGDDGARDASPAGGGRWTFTDDLGRSVSLPERPARIAAYVGTAAALWDLGVESVGVFGTLFDADGEAVAAAGSIDVAAVEHLGEEEVDLEALAALAPDLVVLQGGPSGLDPWPLTDEQLPRVEEIAPYVAVRGYGAPAREIILGYERLAGALGADLDAPALVAAREELESATESLRAAIDAKPGLVAMFTYANEDGLWVAKADDFPDLLEYRRLGLDVVEAGGPDDYFEMLSWEQAGRYPADVILHDRRPSSLQPDELTRFPTWTRLPAVAAGQVGPWNAETVLSPQGFAAAVAGMAATIGAARADVV